MGPLLYTSASGVITGIEASRLSLKENQYPLTILSEFLIILFTFLSCLIIQSDYKTTSHFETNTYTKSAITIKFCSF